MSLSTILINIPPHITLTVTDDQFEALARVNRDLRLERTATGSLIIMPPIGSETGNTNVEIAADFVIWNRQTQLGKVFDSSTGFQLPNGAYRSPDVSWVKLERWEALSTEERQGFAPLCPDFVLELRSPADKLKPLQDKMREYLDNGAKLGWLIDRAAGKVEIYQGDREVEILSQPATLSGENILPGFSLNLNKIW
jgi:Uma2 family endonuclease